MVNGKPDARKWAGPVWGRAGGKGLCKQYLVCGLFHEVLLKINGETHNLWRAVDQDGNVLDILVQSRRNKAAAKKFFHKLLKGCQNVPRVMVLLGRADVRYTVSVVQRKGPGCRVIDARVNASRRRDGIVSNVSSISVPRAVGG